MAKSNSKPVKKKNNHPSKYTPETITKLEAAFANAFTVEEACLYSDISKVTFYDWLEKKPSFALRIEKAKNSVGMKAKQVVVGAVNKGDVETSKWWLKSKHPEEFGGVGQIGNTFNFNFINKARDDYQ